MVELRFRYTRIPAPHSEAFPDLAYYSRPIIPVVLRHGKAATRVLALIDSGADNTIFSDQLAALLGMNLRRAPRDSFCGTSGREQVARYLPVTMQFPGVSYAAAIGFTRLPLGVAGLLGQVGFFDRFVVTLDQSQGSVVLRHRQ